MRHKTPGGHGSCVCGSQTGSRRQLVMCCLIAQLWLAATRTAQGFGHHIKLAGKACPMLTRSSAGVFHLRVTCLTPSSAPGPRDLLIGLCRPAQQVLQLRGVQSSTACKHQTHMHAADYGPPGFFAAHPLVPGFQLRDRFIGLDMDLHAGELMAAYKYEARPHVRNEVVKDGLNIRVQARRPARTSCDLHGRAHRPHTLQLEPSRRLSSMPCAGRCSRSC